MGNEGQARFTEQIMPHLAEAFALAQWITGNRFDAEDVLQDACLLALRTIWRIADGDGRAWILTVVRNAAHAWLRKNRSATFVPFQGFQLLEDEIANRPDADIESPESAVIAKADTAHLEVAIARLPAAFRETILLRDIKGLSYREISELTGAPIGTVMSRLARGRSRVIKILLKKRRDAFPASARAGSLDRPGTGRPGSAASHRGIKSAAPESYRHYP
jgi:RNA polymerase sigma-70 factor (ECF subfamily)